MSTPRRLLMTADAVGGVWSYALDLAAALARRHGVETTLAVLGPLPDEDQRWSAGLVPGLRLVETALPLDWLAGRPEEVEVAGRRIAALAVETGAEIVQLNAPALAARAVFPVPTIAVHHSCVTTWWGAVRTGPLPEDFVWRSELVGRGLFAADAAVAPSRAFARATQSAYRLPALPHAVWNGRTAPPEPEAAPAGAAEFVFGAGRLWDEGKNVQALDGAAARLGVRLLLAGPLTGPNGASVAPRHGLCLGTLGAEAMRDCLARRPVFASTALFEPFGLAVLEAAQAGCALVLSDIPTFRELWADAAVFVSPRDEAAIAAALDRVLRDRGLRDQLGEAARRRAARYTIAAMADRMAGLYRGLAATAARRPAREAAE
ncbi:glycosyltransferase family 4 protein [Inquilinus limosus]|uniref:glycosyltransferase family 4 protein n=1 Tax=Inquilinus limosus TaxID=171674 RepID=UPI001FE19658|nr:glycosyltransferase family 4 protein [Inquilinus limosus]